MSPGLEMISAFRVSCGTRLAPRNSNGFDHLPVGIRNRLTHGRRRFELRTLLRGVAARLTWPGRRGLLFAAEWFRTGWPA